MAVTIWTQADIDKLKAAVASGVLTVRYGGPPERETTYQSLGAMRALLAEMRREVNGETGYRLAASRTGLDRTPFGGGGGFGGRGGGGFGGL